MELEKKSELKGPFKEFFLPRTTMNLDYQAELKKRKITKDVNTFDDNQNAKKKYIKQIMNKRNSSRSFIPTKTISVNKDNEVLPTSHQPTKTEPNLKKQLYELYPHSLLSFIDPYEMKNIPKKRIKSAKPQSVRKFKVRRMQYDDTEYYLNLAKNTHEIGDVDFKLITDIQKQQEKIDKELKTLHVPEEDKKNKKEKPKEEIPQLIKKSKTRKKPIIAMQKVMPSKSKIIKYKYIPISNKYKEINFHKECIFNNEFSPLRRKHIPSAGNRVTTAPTLSKISLEEESTIKKKAKKIHSNLREIKKVLVQDKNFTHRTIERTIKKREKITNKEEAFIKREVKKDVMLTLFIENKGFKEKVAVNTFGKLKRVLEVTNNKGEDPINEVLASTLVKFCKREHFEMFLRNQTIKNNYGLRLMHNRKIDHKIKAQLQEVGKNNDAMKYLERQINQSKYSRTIDRTEQQ